MKVSLLYVDDCPNWHVADARLTEALHLTGHSDLTVERRLITTDAEAQAAHFRGSPTVLVDEEDPFVSDDPGPFGLTCRLYRSEAGPAGSPTVDQLVEVLASRA